MPSNRELLDPSRMPRHVGIIMDGNGRWATERRYPRVYGHRNAVKAVRATVEAAVELELEVLTLSMPFPLRTGGVQPRRCPP